jgi:putative phosphoribosyl transferase
VLPPITASTLVVIAHVAPTDVEADVTHGTLNASEMSWTVPFAEKPVPVGPLFLSRSRSLTPRRTAGPRALALGTERPTVKAVTGFRDRTHAGRLLAERLSEYAGRDDVIVLGLPRGGVPVAFEIARALDAPLDVFLVRKLGVPGHEELALGAIATGGTRVLNNQLVESLGIPREWIEAIDAEEMRELERRERAYRGDRPPPDLAGRTVILVDDGLATGSTMLAAVQAVRQAEPARVVVAVPVAPPEVCGGLREHAEEVVCLLTPPLFGGVGAWYSDFSQTTDEEVRKLLERRVTPRA